MPDEEMEEKNRMVKLVVTIDEELLRRVDTSLQPDLAAEGIENVEKGLNFITNSEPCEISHVPECQTFA